MVVNFVHHVNFHEHIDRHGMKVAQWGYWGQYLPCLSICYVAINKDLEKLKLIIR